jgi:integrase
VTEGGKTHKRYESWGRIRRLPSGRVQASHVVDGETFTAPTTFSDDIPAPGRKGRTGEDHARDWLRGVRVDIERGTWKNPREAATKPRGETFGTYAHAWVEQRRSGKGDALRPKTATEYRRQLDKGLSEFADDLIGTITPARVRAWHAKRAATAPTAAGAEARLLRAVLNTAVLDGLIDHNPVPTNFTRTSAGRAHRPPTMDELTTILETIDVRFRLAIILSAYGGLRLSEWRALRRRDLVEANDRYLIIIERQAQFIGGTWVIGKPKSSEGERTVALPSWASDEVSAHLARHVDPLPDALLFAPLGGSQFIHDSAFRDVWNPAREAAGLRVPEIDTTGKQVGWVNIAREHDLRAFAGTLHAQSGATLRETMAFLGHSTTQAAMAYQHASADRLREIADRMPAPQRKLPSS